MRDGFSEPSLGKGVMMRECLYSTKAPSSPPSRFPSSFALRKSFGSLEISQPLGLDIPFSSLFWWSRGTFNLFLIQCNTDSFWSPTNTAQSMANLHRSKVTTRMNSVIAAHSLTFLIVGIFNHSSATFSSSSVVSSSIFFFMLWTGPDKS